jgi:ketosteroid isomerase-like protein
MSSGGTPARVAEHVAAFNQAVRSADWDAFTDRFAADATLDFPGLPVGPFSGHAQIAGAYAGQPPTDTLSVSDVSSAGPVDTVHFRWSAGGTGVMTITWHDGLVSRLDVTFGS